jgi:hypothetical protein
MDRRLARKRAELDQLTLDLEAAGAELLTGGQPDAQQREVIALATGTSNNSAGART